MYRALAVLALALPALAQVDYVDPVKPFSKRVEGTSVGPVAGGVTRVPYITWGGDMVTLLANGGNKTQRDSIYGRAGLDLDLVQQDDFVAQVKDYMSGKSPYLRGTLGMIHVASEVLSSDPRTRPIVIVQLTWSAGGDCLVVRPGIETVRDLNGKKVVLQQYSPHIDYLDVLLRDSGLTWKDVKPRFVAQITAPTGDTGGKFVDPANAFRNDPDVAAVFVISPDMLALTSGGKVGTGAEDSVKGAKCLLSTKTASRVIADVYAVRADWFQSHADDVKKLVIGFLQASENVAKMKKDPAKNAAALKALYALGAEGVFGSAQMTADAEGLLGDGYLVGLAGNVSFFTDKGNLQNFPRASDRIESFLVREGYLAAQQQVADAAWKYDEFKAQVEAVVEAGGSRFDTKAVEKGLAENPQDSTVLFSFSILFEPNQKTFDSDKYFADYERVLDLSSRYAGAVVEVVGHADPSRVRKLEKQNAAAAIVAQTKQSALNLSLQRSNEVRDSLIRYGQSKGITFDVSQFVTTGKGIDEPVFPRPQNEQEWHANMRVVFRVLNVEAEFEKFEKY